MFLQINPYAFIDSLYYMGVGMLSIFLVIGAIALVTVGLERTMKAIEEKKNNQAQ